MSNNSHTESIKVSYPGVGCGVGSVCTTGVVIVVIYTATHHTATC